MPRGDIKLLKADPDDGTTPIANLLLEALAIAKLSGREKGAVLFLWRVTYGWAKDGQRLKEREISMSAWARVLDSDEPTASRTLSGLEDQSIITRRFSGAGGKYTYSMNTRVAEWDKGCINIQLLQDLPTLQLSKPRGWQKQQPLAKSPTHGMEKNTTHGLSKNTTPSDTGLASPKEILNKSKENIHCLFDFWNDKKIIVHKKLLPETETAIKGALKSYSLEEIEQSISNYAEIVGNEKYFFKHLWTLRDFLKRGFEKFLDGDIARQNYLEKKTSAERKPNSSQSGVNSKYKEAE